VVDTFASHRGFNPCESLSFVLDAAHYSAAHLAVLSVVDAVVSFFFFSVWWATCVLSLSLHLLFLCVTFL
jgi:hypothetical protein